MIVDQSDTDPIGGSATDACQPRKVLIAEDELLPAKSLEGYLKDLSYEVIGPAPNGKRAIELAREHRPDLALMDIQMPEMDGLTAAETIYSELGIPVVILSAYSTSDYVERASETGVFGYLLKPASPDALRAGLTVAWKRFTEYRDAKQEASDLERKLEERKIVERAKGVLMDKLKLSEADAMRRLQSEARNARKKMIDLAKEILESNGLA